MYVTRRNFNLGALALALSGCTASPTGRPATTALPDDLRPVRNSAYDAWVASFQQRARAAGITDDTLRRAFQGTGYLPGVVRRDRNQTEFKRSLEDYLSIAVSDERVAQGRDARRQYASVLETLEARYGVDANIITAIWGLESFYGARRGNVPVVSATSTLAFDGRRGAFFEKQLIEALRIVQSGDITADRLVGSWAGAMGHTQFIPTSYQAFAVDFTGDGRRDIWSDDPSDALASAAAYLERNGWVRGQRWGNEVTGAASGTIIQPQENGPRFAVNQNFRVIKRYNNSDAYAIGVGHLSDRIAGRGPLVTPFPPDENGLTKDDRIALQIRLTASGFDTQGADGVIGPNSQAAIRAYQASQGLPVTGVPSPQLLDRLQ
ncbi:lytic murein transglycosylase [Roseobacter denitrificans]|uniref:Peptidoglycan binding domain protein n=1 Tax=Roseobacter denitrificans (strain ATCC 33942 / OCh 114) TaxID=375451 RepID=Q16B67_ROSDO|nr:lytic murein transglycosylase [Roseobacter denitrificans]ABG30776.1 peptidoglycan binding domain protein [Roseobacter denitrificans OCh 114]AVL53884.1 lytic murein transglycosylase [Roseobacter denitrificans]SFG46916.1 lytic murein transglycosylase [Roseobacter denitrificans OCh 114]